MLVFAATPNRILWHLYAVDDTGHNLRCLTDSCSWNATYCHSLHLSPMKTQIVVAAYVAEHDTTVWHKVDFTTGQTQALPFPLTAHVVAWLPNDQLCYMYDDAYWLAYPDGTQQQCIARIPPHFHWSPDGTTVSYKRDDDHRLYVAKSDGTSRQTYLLDIPEDDHWWDGYRWAWSPNMQYLAYVANYTELWLLRAHDLQQQWVADVEYFWLDFQWSPDNTAIGFVVARDEGGPETSEGTICLVDVQTRQQQRVGDMCSGRWRWGTNGTDIVYTTHEQDGIGLYMVNIATKRIQPIVSATHGFTSISDFVIV